MGMYAMATAQSIDAFTSWSESKKQRRQQRRDRGALMAEQRRAFKRGRNAIGRASTRLNFVMGQGEREIRKGYDAALSETSQAQNVGSRAIMDARARREGEIADNVLSRGFSGTTAREDQARGLEIDTHRQLSNNAASFSLMRSQIHQGRAQSLAQHFQTKWAAEAQSVWDPWFDLMTGFDGYGSATPGDQAWAPPGGYGDTDVKFFNTEGVDYF